MKASILKPVMVLVAAFTVLSVSAQSYLEDPRYGNTPEECRANAMTYQFFRDSYNNKDYPQAIAYMNELLEKAPMASENIFIYGTTMYKNKIARSTSVAERNIAIDSLFILYDLRINYYKDHPQRGEAYLKGLKAREYLVYKPKDTDNLFRLFREAIDAAGNSVGPDYINIYFQALGDAYKQDLVEADDILNEYDRLSPLFDLDDSPARAEAKKTFDALFIDSGVADCDNLQKVYEPRLAAAPDDEQVLEKAFKAMSKVKCTSDFYLSVAEKYYAQKPSANVALALSAIFEDKKEFTKALKYLNEAVVNEEDPLAQANLYVRIAAVNINMGNARAGAEAARQGLAANPENGYAQMLLAQSYATGASTACSGFDRQSAFWLIYDMLAEAKRMLMLAGETDMVSSIDSQMASYRACFPSKEECFFRNLNNGESFNVSCGWITGRTTVRQGQ